MSLEIQNRGTSGPKIGHVNVSDKKTLKKTLLNHLLRTHIQYCIWGCGKGAIPHTHYRSKRSLRRSHFALWTMEFGGAEVTALTLGLSVMLYIIFLAPTFDDFRSTPDTGTIFTHVTSAIKLFHNTKHLIRHV